MFLTTVSLTLKQRLGTGSPVVSASRCEEIQIATRLRKTQCRGGCILVLFIFVI